jgi:hypothetical protein
MKIDVHTHIFPDKMAERVIQQLLGESTEPIQPSGLGTVQDLIARLKSSGIDRAVTCPIATKPEHFDGILQHAMAIREGRCGIEASQMLIPFGSVHPQDPLRFKRLQELAEKNIVGIKLHPYYQEFSLGSSDSIDLLRCCRDLDLTVLCHCGFDIAFAPTQICSPAHVLNIYERIPQIKFIAAHLGGWRQWKKSLDLLVGKPILMDTSILEPDYHTPEIREILEQHPAEKLLFASDWPWQSFERSEALIQSLNISQGEKKLIMGGNAERLLKENKLF